jgi:8-oxo-dGTP diphosphatase
MPKQAPENSRSFLVVAAALATPDGRFLMQQRPAGKEHGGLWEFPGGKVEANETPEEALIRELREELDITVELADLYPVSFASRPAPRGRQLVLLLYRIGRWLGEPRAIEAAGLCWGVPQALGQLAMPPGDAAFVDLLIRLEASRDEADAETAEDKGEH